MLEGLLTNEAISNYITFIAGILVAILGGAIRRRLQRKKPSIIRVEKVYETSLIEVDSEVRDKIGITYEGQSINELHQAIFTANNIGEKPIENVRLDFFLENLAPDDFLEVILTNAEEVQEIVAGPLGQDFESFAIELPFLNPRKEYEDYLGITIYAPKPLVVKTVTGKGLGWSTKYFDRVAYRRKIETSLAAILARSTSPAIQIAVKVLNLLSR